MANWCDISICDAWRDSCDVAHRERDRQTNGQRDRQTNRQTAANTYKYRMRCRYTWTSKHSDQPFANKIGSKINRKTQSREKEREKGRERGRQRRREWAGAFRLQSVIRLAGWAGDFVHKQKAIEMLLLWKEKQRFALLFAAAYLTCQTSNTPFLPSSLCIPCSPVTFFNCCQPTRRWTKQPHPKARPDAVRRSPPLRTPAPPFFHSRLSSLWVELSWVVAWVELVGTWKRHQSKSWQHACPLSASSRHTSSSWTGGEYRGSKGEVLRMQLNSSDCSLRILVHFLSPLIPTSPRFSPAYIPT